MLIERYDMTKQEIISAIEREIDNLPPIPENITKIRQSINDPNSSNKSIANLVKQDPALTANVLKVANSAWYSVMTKIDNVERAITTIGLKQLSSLLLTIGAKKIMDDKFSAMEELWEESSKCAFFSQSIMKMKNGSSDDMESAYTAGLLHDIGKIILLSISPQLMKKITNMSEIKNMAPNIIEKLAIGVTSSEIGEKITEKWNFPKHISKTIANQYTPKLVEDEYIPLTYTVYLANTLNGLSPLSDDLRDKIEPKVLEYFKLENEDQIQKLIRSLRQFYVKVGKGI